MSSMVSKCGINCGACPWGPYPRRGMSAEEFENYRNKAKSILGYMPIQTPCVTCQTPDEKIPKTSKLPNRKCLIRQCVDRASVANCAYCTRFPCETLKQTAGAWSRESIESKLGTTLSKEDYRAFVEPFEGIKRLEAIRTGLPKEAIAEPTKASTSGAKIAAFPGDLAFSKSEISAFKAVYDLLKVLHDSSLGMDGTDTFAQQHKLDNLRAHVFRFFWIFACYGRQEGERLVIEPEAYFANRGSEKTLAIWSFVEGTIFRILSGQGVLCKRSVLEGVEEVELTTGTGYLRGRGWTMDMWFESKLGGVVTLRALQAYARLLEENFGKKSFRQFINVDMQVLAENNP